MQQPYYYFGLPHVNITSLALHAVFVVFALAAEMPMSLVVLLLVLASAFALLFFLFALALTLTLTLTLTFTFTLAIPQLMPPAEHTSLAYPVTTHLLY